LFRVQLPIKNSPSSKLQIVPYAAACLTQLHCDFLAKFLVVRS
jgi:hypothetical protein